MTDLSTEYDRQYDRFLTEFEAFLRTRRKKRRSWFEPLVWFERLLNWMLKGVMQVADSVVMALTR